MDDCTRMSIFLPVRTKNIAGQPEVELQIMRLLASTGGTPVVRSNSDFSKRSESNRIPTVVQFCP